MPVTVIDHPLLNHKLGQLRAKTSGSEQFRQLLGELSVQLFIESNQSSSTCSHTIETPFSSTTAEQLEKPITLIPIMRTGIGMQEAIQRFWPACSVGHLGIYRDAFLETTVEYFCKMPKGLENSRAYLLDPVIATGRTAVASIERLQQMGATDIQFLTLIACSQGLETLNKCYPDVQVFTYSDNEQITDKGFLTPGIGDVGVRYYNS